MGDLLPCPHCGGSARAASLLETSAGVVVCVACTAAVTGWTEAEAVAAWNRRVSPTIPHRGTINEPSPKPADIDPLSR